MDTRCPWCGLDYGTGGEFSHWCENGQKAKRAAIEAEFVKKNLTQFLMPKPKEPENVIYNPATGKEVPKTRLFDTEWTQFPVCPYCGTPDQDWWDGLSLQVYDGTQWDAYCDHCEKDYKVTACIDTTFRTEKE